MLQLSVLLEKIMRKSDKKAPSEDYIQSAHFQTMTKTHATFRKNRKKAIGVAHTMYLPLLQKDGILNTLSLTFFEKGGGNKLYPHLLT